MVPGHMKYYTFFTLLTFAFISHVNSIEMHNDFFSDIDTSESYMTYLNCE